MKLGFNQGTSLGCSNLEQDLKYCEEQGFDYIEIHTPKLREYLETHAKEELKEFFSSGRLKPYSFKEWMAHAYRTGVCRAMDLDGMFRVLKEKGYDEAASVEVFRPAYYELSAEENIRTAKEKSKSCP